MKVVHRLSQLAYIETSKGKGGGLKIAADSGKLRLGDLVTSLEPSMNMVECFDPDTNRCRMTSNCRLKRYLKTGHLGYIDSLNQYTLADASPAGRKTW